MYVVVSRDLSVVSVVVVSAHCRSLVVAKSVSVHVDCALE